MDLVPGYQNVVRRVREGALPLADALDQVPLADPALTAQLGAAAAEALANTSGRTYGETSNLTSTTTGPNSMVLLRAGGTPVATSEAADFALARALVVPPAAPNERAPSATRSCMTSNHSPARTAW